MRKTRSSLSSLAFIFGLVAFQIIGQFAMAAPAYVGPGCDANGEHCWFGTPSGRVAEWFKRGTVQEMGQRCENFINNIEQRKNKINETMPFVLAYKRFTARWSHIIEADGRAQIICSIDLHAELPDTKFEWKTHGTFNWTCDNKDSGGLCLHTVAECEQLKKDVEKQEDILDVRLQFGGSLLQGQICEVISVKPIKIIKEKPQQQNSGRNNSQDNIGG